jgi:hypothetical protein
MRTYGRNAISAPIVSVLATLPLINRLVHRIAVIHTLDKGVTLRLSPLGNAGMADAEGHLCHARLYPSLRALRSTPGGVPTPYWLN